MNRTQLCANRPRLKSVVIVWPKGLQMRLFKKEKDEKYEEAAQLLADGEYKRAISLLEVVLEEDPKHTNALTSMGVAMISMHINPNLADPNIKEGLEYLNRAAEIDPEDPVPVFNKAVLLRKLNRREEAIEAFKEVLEIEERQPLALLHIAEINYELERWETAIEYARLAVIRDPALKEALKWVPEAMEKARMLDEENAEEESDAKLH